MSKFIDQVHINGQVCGWRNTIFSFDGETFVGYTSISWGHSVELTPVYGAGSVPLGTVVGPYTADPVEIEGPAFAIYALRYYFVSRSTDGTLSGAVIEAVTLQYYQGDLIREVVFENVRWPQESASHSQGPDALSITVSLYCERIKVDGVYLVTNQF